jgi:hypothetical protein
LEVECAFSNCAFAGRHQFFLVFFSQLVDIGVAGFEGGLLLFLGLTPAGTDEHVFVLLRVFF